LASESGLRLRLRIRVSDSEWVYDRAASPVSRTNLEERRVLDGTSIDSIWAAGHERASLRKLCDGRNRPVDGRERNGAVRR
jgi:hypothetical protein